MPHKIHTDSATGKVSMMYVGEPPWHGLGTQLSGPATAAEAIQAANLNWRVVKKPIYAVEGLVRQRIPDKFAVVREDKWGRSDCSVFGIVGTGYTPLQNEEAFQFFDPIVGKNAAIYHTAGALGEGERVWILAKLPSDIRVVGDDIAHKYLLLSNSHDGNSSVQIKFTPIRVVCQNTLTMALSQGPTLRVVHTRDLRERLRNAEKSLGLIHRRFNELEEAFVAMAQVRLNEARLAEYLKLVFPDPPEPHDRPDMARAAKDRAWAEYFFVHGKGNDREGVTGTLWAAYNGIAEYVDHRQFERRPNWRWAMANSSTGADSERLKSAWFGEGYLVKARAYRVAEDNLNRWLN